jgi:hypothetical protein
MDIFDVMSGHSIQLKQAFPWFDEEQESEIRINIDMNPNAEHYTVV